MSTHTPPVVTHHSAELHQRMDDISKALDHLKTARALLTRAKAPRATDAVRRALKSAEGAERHAYGQQFR